MNTWSDNSLICPYCGHERKVVYEDFEDCYAEDETEIQCDECEKYFTAARYVSFDYETFKNDEANEE